MFLNMLSEDVEKHEIWEGQPLANILKSMKLEGAAVSKYVEEHEIEKAATSKNFKKT